MKANAMTLYEKLSLVMKNCSYIAKTGENTFHGYSYVTSNDVLERINDSFTSVGLVTTVSPTLLDLREVQTAKGTIDKHATVSVSITITDIETGDSVDISGIGSGQDSGDKSIMKAETAAIKYAYMLTFCIATGDDPEADHRLDVDTTPTSPTKVSTAPRQVPTKDSTNSSAHSNSNSTLHCTDCGVTISGKVATFSKNRYHMPLCMNCQKQQHQSA